MIFASRDKVTAPASLTEPTGKGPKETKRAQKSLEDWKSERKAPDEWTFKFKAYSSQDVKDAL